MTPTLILTRPAPQASAVVEALGNLAQVVISPVLEIRATGQAVDLAGYRGVILTSANAVGFAEGLAGKRVYCVGKRTAEVARVAGAEVGLVASDADDLVDRIETAGPLVHLCGAHRRGAVAERLSLAGLETHEVVIYDQVALPLSTEARGLIEGELPVVLPLYSPRSAELVAAGLARVGPGVRAIAMSPAVAEAWRAGTGAEAEVAPTPTGAAMLTLIAEALRG